MVNKNALCIMCRKPHSGNLLVAEEIIKCGQLDVIFIMDEPYTPPMDVNPRIQFVYVDDQTCIDMGYQYSCKFVSFTKDVVAWDKAFYHFGCREHSYDFVWLMEDDIFIPSTELLCRMTEKYSQYDVVMGKVLDIHGHGKRWFSWHHVIRFMEEPHLCGRVCGVGVSRKLFEVAAEYVKKNKRIPFIEGFIPSIAGFHQLKIIEVFELFGVINCLHRPMCPLPFHCNGFDYFSVDDFIMFSKHNPSIILHGIKKEDDYCKLFHEIYNKYPPLL